MKIGIVGSRTRNTTGDYNKVNEKFNWIMEKIYKVRPKPYEYGDIQIVSGGQRYGADGWAETIAKENRIPITIYHADWDSFGLAAGPIRNEFIARESDILIACPAPDSKGTNDTIEKFKKFHPDGELILV